MGAYSFRLISKQHSLDKQFTWRDGYITSLLSVLSEVNADQKNSDEQGIEHVIIHFEMMFLCCKKKFWLSVYGTDLLSSEGRPCLLVGFMTDIMV